MASGGRFQRTQSFAMIAMGTARLAPAKPPPPAATADVSTSDVYKLAVALLEGCATRSREIRVALDGADLVVRPAHFSNNRSANETLGGPAAFQSAGHKLAASFGVVPASKPEVARWAYAAWRIPHYRAEHLPPETVEEEGGEYSVS